MSDETPTKQSRQNKTAAKASATDASVTEKAVKTTAKKKTTRKKVAAKAGSKKASPKKAKASQAIEPLASPQPEPARSSNAVAWVALLGSIVALGLSGYAAYQTTLSSQLSATRLSGFDERLTFLGAEQKGLLSELSAVKQSGNAADEAQGAQLGAIEQRLVELNASVSGIELASEATTDKIKAGLGKNVARWKLDEVQSLLSRVNQYYQLTGDKDRAEQGLRLAQKTLESVENPRLKPVKDALAEDLLRIKSDNIVDTESIHTRLVALSALIPDLKLVGDAIKAVEKADPAEQAVSDSPEDDGLLAAGKSLLGDLSGLVKYRKLDAPLRPSLDGSERFLLYELLQLKVQTAIIALMRHNDAVYQTQLQRAIDDLNTYFDLEQANTQTAMQALNELAQQSVALDVEPVSSALMRLNEVILLEQ